MCVICLVYRPPPKRMTDCLANTNNNNNNNNQKTPKRKGVQVYTHEECLEWLEVEPLVNPRTGRRIKEDGPIFRQLVKDSGGNRPDPALIEECRRRCRKTWVSVNAFEHGTFDCPVIRCPECNGFRQLYVVHTTLGDYVCPKCNMSCRLTYFCVSCYVSGAYYPTNDEDDDNV